MSNVSDHTVTDAPDHDHAKRRLAEMLTDFGVGQENAIAGRDLAERTPVGYSAARDLIPKLRTEYALPVASCSEGYFVVSNPDELADVIDRIDSEIQTRRKRKRDLVQAYNR